MAYMLKRKFWQTISLCAGFVIIVGLLRPPSETVDSGVYPKEFWVRKMLAKHGYDVVLAGDSRVYRGLSPEAMQSILKNSRVFNFAFDGNGYSREYLQATEEVIDEASAHKIVVLGITPKSLTPNSAEKNGFTSLEKKGRFGMIVDLYLTRHLDFFRPYTPFYYLYLIRGHAMRRYIQEFHKDGWIASRKVPEDPEEQLRRYEGVFANNKVSDQLVAQILDFVEKWRQQGIRVFGFRPPTPEAMLEYERKESGFDEAEFRQIFQEAGGVWLDFEASGYHSYDGSHLREDAARKLSVDLATIILQYESGVTYARDDR